jgi:MFS family permease
MTISSVFTVNFFALLQVLNETFPDHTFLMNGLIMGIKVGDRESCECAVLLRVFVCMHARYLMFTLLQGILSFLSAPLIGALSDVWGRKFFLLITVFFTCAPIPLMTINTW